MAGLSRTLDEWDEAFLQSLVDDKAQETLTLEFKRELELKSESQKKEAAKDISAMANTAGGWIIYGIDETKTATGAHASKIVPLTTDPVDQLAQVLSAALHPRVRWRSRLVPVQGGKCLVLRVEQSQDVLHQVSAYGDFRFYRRHERGVEKMTEPEIARAFERFVRLREDANARLHTIAQSFPRRQPPDLFLVLMPLGAPDDLVDPRDFPRDLDGLMRLGKRWNALEPAADGVRAEDTLHIRRDGTIFISWSTVAMEKRWFPQVIMKVLADLTTIARAAWRPRFFGAARLLVKIDVGPDATRPQTLDQDDSLLELTTRQRFQLPVSDDDIDGPPLRLFREVLDRLWHAMSLPRSPFFNDAGAFVAPYETWWKS